MSKLNIKDLPEDWLFPTTRYRGSKRKILHLLWTVFDQLEFATALDLFGGTSSVSLLLKRMGKQVTYNDYLRYNYLTGVAFIENSGTLLSNGDIEFIFSNNENVSRDGFISRTFKDYYFLDRENIWLDKVIANLNALENNYEGNELKLKKAIGFWALGQACLIKRPFNLFHRKNLSIRTNNVDRKFGNKTTWEMPFSTAMRRFVGEANETIFDNGMSNSAYNQDAFSFSDYSYDLVYLDPPYFFKNQKDKDYRKLYHFLEGIAQYGVWGELIDYATSNLRLKQNGYREWPSNSYAELTDLFTTLFNRFKDSIIVVSHKSGSIIEVDTICSLLSDLDKSVSTYKKPYTYALSKRNGKPQHNTEWLIVGI